MAHWVLSSCQAAMYCSLSVCLFLCRCRKAVWYWHHGLDLACSSTIWRSCCDDQQYWCQMSHCFSSSFADGPHGCDLTVSCYHDTNLVARWVQMVAYSLTYLWRASTDCSLHRSYRSWWLLRRGPIESHPLRSLIVRFSQCSSVGACVVVSRQIFYARSFNLFY